MDLLAQFRASNRAFFDTIFISYYCGTDTTLGILQSAGLFQTSREWRAYPALIANMRDPSKCWLYDYDVLEAAKYSAERDDIVTLTRACHHLIASNGYDECNLTRWINPIADIAVARGSLRACEAIARSIHSWTLVPMAGSLFGMMYGAIRTDNAQILEFCIMFLNYYIHDSRESCHIIDLGDAPDLLSKCAEFLDKYDHCIALQRKINDEIVAKK